jgi:hypothetical protein
MIRRYAFDAYTRIFAAFVFALCLGAGLFGQSAKAVPEPYTKDEFPEWANDLRRAEIVSIGSFPLSYLVTTLVFDIGRYVDKLSTDPENANYYAPLFFGNANKKIYTEEEKTGLILGSIGVSVAIAIVDFIIGQVEKSEARDRELRRAAAAEAREHQTQAETGTGPEAQDPAPENPSENEAPDNSGTESGKTVQDSGS